ncbi:MAG: molybdenum cofactor biosynthesis protein MoaE [Cyanobacteria bacterium]|nr:molybdenum cofactor biosynthesis protein MoaE [Cyanobacteria bacterium bin.51]
MVLRVALHLEPFDPLVALAAWQRHREQDVSPQAPWARAAAEAHFIGRVRSLSANGEPLAALELEHYPGMTEAQIERLAAAVLARHGLAHALVEHRVGRALPGEALVLVAVGADRRGPAQRGCQELLEALKHDAPFWKREWCGADGRWLEGNTPL